jgi:hypothetical protein
MLKIVVSFFKNCHSLRQDVVKACLPDFAWYNIPKRGKIPNYNKLNQRAINISSGRKLFEMDKNIPTFLIPRPSKTYPN